MPVPAPDQPAPESIVLDRFDGLKNTVQRERLGPRDLAKAVNVDLDDTGQTRRRRGFTKVASGGFHSLWNANNQVVYGVKDGDLGIVNPDYSFLPLRNNVGGDFSSGASPLAYAQVGDNLYYTCATDAGIIDTAAQVVGDWGPSQDFWLSPVVNPTATLAPIRGKLLGRPPLATSLAYYNGRLYMGSGKVVWATELYLYDLVDKTRTFFPFEGEVLMVGSVVDGIYVGTDEGVWFLSGDSFPLKRARVMDSPVIPGTMVYIPAELGNPPEIGPFRQENPPMEMAIAFMTTRGFCVGEDGGKATNLTESRFFFPGMARGASMFRRQDGFNQYVVVGDSEGQPVNGAAIGDYVDATIVRARDKWAPLTEGFQIGDQFQPTWR